MRVELGHGTGLYTSIASVVRVQVLTTPFVLCLLMLDACVKPPSEERRKQWAKIVCEPATRSPIDVRRTSTAPSYNPSFIFPSGFTPLLSPYCSCTTSPPSTSEVPQLLWANKSSGCRLAGRTERAGCTRRRRPLTRQLSGGHSGSGSPCARRGAGRNEKTGRELAVRRATSALDPTRRRRSRGHAEALPE